MIKPVEGIIPFSAGLKQYSIAIFPLFVVLFSFLKVSCKLDENRIHGFNQTDYLPKVDKTFHFESDLRVSYN